MSRQGAGTPEFRLRFDYPYIELERVGAPSRRVSLDAGDPAPALRAFAAEVARSGGRLTATLPEAEVWRGRVAASAGGEVARRTAAAALGATPQGMQVALGPAGVDGLRPAAAVRRDTLRDARAFLARCGLRPARFTGAGVFPGFDGPPSFARVALPAMDPGGARAGACGLAAVLALTLWFAPWRADAPAQPTLVASAPVAASPLEPPVVAPVAPPSATEITQASPRPRARPADLAPAPASASVRPPLVAVSLASRNAPADLPQPPIAAPAARAAVAIETLVSPLPRPRSPAKPAVAAAQPDPNGPLPRPAALSGAAKPTASLVDPARAPGAPLPRPAGSRAEAQVASLGPAVRASDAAAPPPVPAVAADGPRARPAGLAGAAPKAAVAVAALSPAAVAAPAVAAPPRRIAQPAAPAAAAPAKPKVAAAPKPKTVAAAAPAAVRQTAAPTRAPAAAQPKRTVKTQTVRLPQAAKPAGPVVRTAALQAQPVRVQPKSVVQPARAQQVRVQRAPAQPTRKQAASRQPALRGNALSLIGIFGGADGRHALVQLPNGATERVRPGDQLQGVQVTAIAADGVHLQAQGRETVLRLPD